MSRGRALPLRYRLPNPPATFVGRDAEIEKLAAAVERAPVVVVWGPGGFGKTALVLAAMASRFPRRVSRTLFVSLRPGDPPEQLCLDVLRAIGAESGDWSALLRDRAALIATTLDATEAGRFWIVADDLHHVDPAGTGEVLVALARYARRSRWIATSRVEPAAAELVGQALGLGPMPAAELRALGARFAPGADDKTIDRAVAACGGSIPLLPRWIAQFRADTASAGIRLLEGLPIDVVDLLGVLAVVEATLSSDTVARLAPEEALGALDRLGLGSMVERTPAGVRLHDALRPLVRAALPEDSGDRARRAAAVLAEASEPSAAIEALRLLIERESIDRAAALLDRRGAKLIEEGYGPHLVGLLSKQDDARLDRWRLSVAVEVGDVRMLATLRRPGEADLEARWLWARGRLVAGDAAGAADEATRVQTLARERGDRRVAYEAGRLRAQCLGELGRASEALATLESLDPSDDDARTLLGAQIAALRPSEAAVRAERLAPALAKVRPATARRARYTLALALQRAGRFPDAIAMLDPLLAELRAGRPTFLAGAVLQLRAHLALESGAIEECRRLLDRIEPFAAGASWLGPLVAAQRIDAGMAAGELGADLEGAVEALDARGRAAARPPIWKWAIESGLELAVVRGGSLPDFASLDATRFEALEPAQRLWLARWRLRAGERPALPVLPEDPPIGDSLLLRIVAAEAALLHGDPTAAAGRAEAAASVAHEHGHALREADARQTLAAALLVLDRDDALAACARTLGHVVDASARWAAESRFWQVAAGRVPAPAVLADLERLDPVAPPAARRARALLGATPALDALDRIVVDAMERRARPWRIERLGPWGLDEHRRQVWLDDGRTIDFDRRPIAWKLLGALADHGGAATSEQLAQSLWGPLEYHRLRDGNRLQVAVGSLRRLLGDDPKHPERLITTPDGYAFGNPPPSRLRL